MPKSTNPFNGLQIPAPSDGFEDRIIAAARQRSTPKGERPRWQQAGFAAALAAAIAVLWVMPAGVLPPKGLVHGLPLLADLTFEEEDPLRLPAEDLLEGLL